jgi:hypothetical protein
MGCLKDCVVSLDDEIFARIRAAKVWDKDSKLEDFQLRVDANGLVLINLKTGRAELIYDEESQQRDWNELFPDLVIFPNRSNSTACHVGSLFGAKVWLKWGGR